MTRTYIPPNWKVEVLYEPTWPPEERSTAEIATLLDGPNLGSVENAPAAPGMTGPALPPPPPPREYQGSLDYAHKEKLVHTIWEVMRDCLKDEKVRKGMSSCLPQKTAGVETIKWKMLQRILDPQAGLSFRVFTADEVGQAAEPNTGQFPAGAAPSGSKWIWINGADSVKPAIWSSSFDQNLLEAALTILHELAHSTSGQYTPTSKSTKEGESRPNVEGAMWGFARAFWDCLKAWCKDFQKRVEDRLS